MLDYFINCMQVGYLECYVRYMYTSSPTIYFAG